MTCQFVCDNCGKVETGPRGRLQPSPPLAWSIGVMRGGFVHACSVECMKALSEEHMAEIVKRNGAEKIKRERGES